MQILPRQNGNVNHKHKARAKKYVSVFMAMLASSLITYAEQHTPHVIDHSTGTKHIYKKPKHKKSRTLNRQKRRQ